MHEVARASHPRTPLPRKGNPLWLPCRWPTPSIQLAPPGEACYYRAIVAESNRYTLPLCR